MKKTEKISLIKELISGKDLSPAKLYYLEVTESPPNFRQKVDSLVYVSSPEMENFAKSLKPHLFIGVIDATTAKMLLRFFNDGLEPEIIPEPTSQEVAKKIESWLPKQELPPMEVQPTPQQEPPPPPENFIVFRDRGKFRNNRI